MAKRKLLVVLWTISIICLLSGCDVFNTFFQSSLIERTHAQEKTIADTNPPTPGNEGIIKIESQDTCSLVLKWHPASDDHSTQSELDYALFITDNFDVFDDTSGNIKDWTILIEWQKNVDSYRVEGLLPGTLYFFKLMVRDKAGNSAAYRAISANTNDDQEAPHTGTIGVEKISHTSFNLSWPAASDDATTQDKLEYKAFCSSDSNLKEYESKLDELEYYSIALESLFSTQWVVNMTSTSFENLAPATDYYILVFVRDSAGNIAFYVLKEITTASDFPPIPGAGGQFYTYQKDIDYLYIAWNPASDDFDTQDQLEYKVIASTQNDLATLESINPEEDGFVLCQDWTAGSTSLSITNLLLFQEYNINVLVKDSNNNMALYKPIYEKLAKLGDVDQNLLISSDDAKLIAKYDAEFPCLEDIAVANVNGDLEVNIIDALVIQQFYYGQLDSLGNNPVIQADSPNGDNGKISFVSNQESSSTEDERIINLAIFQDTGDKKTGAFKWVISYDHEQLTVTGSGVRPNYSNFSFEYYNINIPRNQGRIIINGFSTKGAEINPEIAMVNIKIKINPLVKSGNTQIALRRVIQVDEKLQTIGTEQDVTYICPLEIR